MSTSRKSGSSLVRRSRPPSRSIAHNGSLHSCRFCRSGTSSGFGKRLVASVLARGDRVIATARDIEKLRAVFPASNPNLHLAVLDISDSTEVIAQRVKAALSVWGRIDVVVNNAGYGVKAILEEGG